MLIIALCKMHTNNVVCEHTSLYICTEWSVPLLPHSKAVVLLLFIQCLLLPSLFVGVCAWFLFCNAVLSVLSCFAVSLLRNREQLVATL